MVQVGYFPVSMQFILTLACGLR